MAEFYTSIDREIEIGHDDPHCGFSHHGHRLLIRVTVRGSYDAARGASISVKGLEMAVDVALSEVHGKPLDIIAPAQPTPEGLGLWIIEKLVGQYPKIVEVQVWRDRQVSFSIKREPR